MQGVKRRVFYVGLYEAIAIVLSGWMLALMGDTGAAEAGSLAICASVIAMVWNFIFNLIFEFFEKRFAVKGRGLKQRILHATGYEGGLTVFLVPVIALWLDVSMWQALLMDLGLIAFFLFYTFAFAWLFDLVFGLPESAGGGQAA